MQTGYVHGYEEAERLRLNDQATTLEALLHHDTSYPPGSTVLEAGCGVGAQTVPLLRNSPEARLTSLDISSASLTAAEALIRAAGLPAPDFQQGDVRALPFADASFDHAFVCFVLEHLPDPAAVLGEMRRVLRPGGSLTVIEGDHGSTVFHPDDPAARDAIRCQVALQRSAGGDAEIGRRLYPLIAAASFDGVRVSPRQFYVDTSRPELVNGFIRKTFTTMVAGVRAEAIRAGLIEAGAFDAGVRALLRTAEPAGTFCYTFFKATALKKGLVLTVVREASSRVECGGANLTSKTRPVLAVCIPTPDGPESAHGATSASAARSIPQVGFRQRLGARE